MNRVAASNRQRRTSPKRTTTRSTASGRQHVVYGSTNWGMGSAVGVAIASGVGKSVKFSTGTGNGVAIVSGVGKSLKFSVGTGNGTADADASSLTSSSIGTANGNSIAIGQIGLSFGTANGDSTVMGIGVPNASQFPSDVFDLTKWKITLPIGSPGSPTEVINLVGFSDQYFFLDNVDGSPFSMVFQTPVTGVTTGGSSFPRTELREMADSSGTEAAWHVSDGTATLTTDLAVTQVPSTGKVVVQQFMIMVVQVFLINRSLKYNITGLVRLDN